MKAKVINEAENAVFADIGLNKETYEKYNTMVFSLMTNIYTISKLNKNEIVLTNFDRNSKLSKCVLIAANYLATAYSWDIKLDLPIGKYLLAKLKFKDVSLKRHNKNKDIVKYVDVLKETGHLNKVFDETYQTWDEIFDKFYGKETTK